MVTSSPDEIAAQQEQLMKQTLVSFAKSSQKSKNSLVQSWHHQSSEYCVAHAHAAVRHRSFSKVGWQILDISSEPLAVLIPTCSFP